MSLNLETRYSDWIEIDQSMIDRFADVTRDWQFIHVDPQRAADTPFGGTVAHGFLTLSLLSHLAETVPAIVPDHARFSVNYGFDRVRFVHPVRSGSRVRAMLTPSPPEEKSPGQFQQSIDVRVEIEGADKPALLATWLIRFFT